METEAGRCAATGHKNACCCSTDGAQGMVAAQGGNDAINRQTQGEKGPNPHSPLLSSPLLRKDEKKDVTAGAAKARSPGGAVGSGGRRGIWHGTRSSSGVCASARWTRSGCKPPHTTSPALSGEGVFRGPSPRAASSCSVQHRQPVLTVH